MDIMNSSIAYKVKEYGLIIHISELQPTDIILETYYSFEDIPLTENVSSFMLLLLTN